VFQDQFAILVESVCSPSVNGILIMFLYSHYSLLLLLEYTVYRYRIQYRTVLY
jgi:hypothetical protein